MKVGDLVGLSAYGKKRRRAAWIERDDVGLVVKVVEHRYVHISEKEYEVHWTKSRLNYRYSWAHERMSQRKDLRYVR